MNIKPTLRIIPIIALLLMVTVSTKADSVIESARNIPLAKDVDVVVVGGTTAAVSAAVQAANDGASVFLAAPRPYLGEDLAGTYRMWINPGETSNHPLALKLFSGVETGLDYTYTTNVVPDSAHSDTYPPSRLKDGLYSSAVNESVQYNSDVTITCNLQSAKQVNEIKLLAYQRNNESNNFEVEKVTIYTSSNGQTWSQLAVVANPLLGQGTYETAPVEIKATVDVTTQYIRLVVEESDDAIRILLAELIIKGGQTQTTLSSLPQTPMHIKATLENALTDAGVDFLYNTMVTDVLTDAQGKPAGIVMANRSGRQAVRAKVIIDATERSVAARLAGAEFSAYPAGPQTFKRVVIGGSPATGTGIQSEVKSFQIKSNPVIEYTLSIDMADGSMASFAEAEEQARDMTYTTGLKECSDMVFHLPPDNMTGRAHHTGSWPDADAINLDAFRPATIDRLYVLNGSADVDRTAVEAMLRPLAQLDLGKRIGQLAATEAASIGTLSNVQLSGTTETAISTGQVMEYLGGLRPALPESPEVIPSDTRSIPVLGQYDVVVIGGGTGGAPAGIGAGRKGAKTLVVEFLHGLGGVGTLGMISRYYYGNRVGFTAEMDAAVATPEWMPIRKMQWYRSELRKANVDIWFYSMGCGAFVEDNKVKGVIVTTPNGRGVVLANVVIDSTGNADIAAAAGAEVVDYSDGKHLAYQGTGLPPREFYTSYTNTDWTFIFDSDPVDTWRAYVIRKRLSASAWDLGQLVDTRERRRIVGDFIISPMDIYNGRTYPDTITMANSNFDTHGYIIHPMFMLRPPDKTAINAYIPYRSLLPKGLDGLIVTGLSISAHRDAVPVIRMQADVQNQGYAVGVAASMVAPGAGVRSIDIGALQSHLYDKGIIKLNVLSHEDSYPYTASEIRTAVINLAYDYKDLEIVLAMADEALPVLRDAYTRSPAYNKLKYASVLAMLCDDTGAATVATEVSSNAWDTGWNYRGMGQYGFSVSHMDAMIIALGRTGSSAALAPILTKVSQLDATKELSHHRAVAVGLETLGNPAGADALYALLNKEDMMGYSYLSIEMPYPATDYYRTQCLREIILARALYRLGDKEGLGETILKRYRRSLHGLYSKHADAVLNDDGEEHTCLDVIMSGLGLAADISGPLGIPDCRVDGFDFAEMSRQWMVAIAPGNI